MCSAVTTRFGGSKVDENTLDHLLVQLRAAQGTLYAASVAVDGAVAVLESMRSSTGHTGNNADGAADPTETMGQSVVS